MTASRKSLFLSDVASNGPLSAASLEYFRQRQRNRLYELVLTQFGKSGLTRAALARRLGCRPEQVTRWLRAPGNWKLDTVSDLLLAVSRSELDAKLSYPLEPVVEAEALSSKNEEQSDFKHDTVLDMSTPPANAAAPNALVSIAIAFVEQRPPGLASERAARRNRSEEPARRTAAPWIELGSNIADGAGGMNLAATDRGATSLYSPSRRLGR